LRRLLAIRVFPSTANFLMFAIRGEPDTGHLGRFTLSRGIAIRDLSTLPGCGTGFYRIGVRLRSDNKRLMLMTARYLGR
jgi:histidinol-phosphate/aromatic aminotransferase/cobyric acid decarboxylase-like protein